jgi:hypothetical protein
LIKSTAVAIMLELDLLRGKGGRVSLLVPGAAAAAEALEAAATSVAMDAMDWFAGPLSYHFGLFEGVDLPEGVTGVSRPDEPYDQ